MKFTLLAVLSTAALAAAVPTTEGEPQLAKRACGKTLTVRAGDSCWALSQKYPNFNNCNKKTDCSRIQPGQKLRYGN